MTDDITETKLTTLDAQQGLQRMQRVLMREGQHDHVVRSLGAAIDCIGMLAKMAEGQGPVSIPAQNLFARYQLVPKT